MFLHCLKQLHCSRHEILALAHIQFLHLSLGSFTLDDETLHLQVFVISSIIPVFAPSADQRILGLPLTTVQPNSESFGVGSWDIALPQPDMKPDAHEAPVLFEMAAAREDYY